MSFRRALAAFTRGKRARRRNRNRGRAHSLTAAVHEILRGHMRCPLVRRAGRFHHSLRLERPGDRTLDVRTAAPLRFQQHGPLAAVPLLQCARAWHRLPWITGSFGSMHGAEAGRIRLSSMVTERRGAAGSPEDPARGRHPGLAAALNGMLREVRSSRTRSIAIFEVVRVCVAHHPGKTGQETQKTVPAHCCRSRRRE